MSAPAIWIFTPLLAGGIIFFFPKTRPAAWTGGVLATLLAFVAFLIPIDTALTLGAHSFKISSSFEILGRNFVINAADAPLVALIFGIAALWFFGAEAAGVSSRFTGAGLSILALLTASIAVEPFLFAAPLLEIASLLAIPFLVMPFQKPPRGAARFLIYQTLAMPFLLMAGWMLAGVEASPGNVGLTAQSGLALGLGFAFLLAVFPLYNWIPMLAEETSPYAVGFLLWALPVFTSIFALSFLDRYTWIRTSPQLMGAIQSAGLFMAVSAGIFSAFQRNLGRMMGYASIVESGLIVFAMSLNSSVSLNIVFLLIVPRGLQLAVWALSVSTLSERAESLRFGKVQGLARAYPLATIALILTNLSMSGFPLLAGFPARLALLEEAARLSVANGFWILMGMLGLLIGAARTLAVLVMAPEETPWKLNESWTQMTMLGIGILGLLLIGLFPQILNPLLSSLPAMFQRLGH